MTGKTVLILGGTSDVGIATARIYAGKGWRVVLAGRNEAELERNTNDLKARYITTEASYFRLDILDVEEFLEERLSPLPDTAICVVGLLGDQLLAQQSATRTRDILRTNFEGPALVFETLARQMAQRGRGTLVGVGSVAGDRGRASNYIYGAAKGGFAIFLSGLRNRLAGTEVRVLTVKPGYIRTRMTAGLKLPNLLTAAPEEVGRAIYRAAEITKRDVIYVRPIWALLMMVVRNIPEKVFKKMKL
jgi:decaprenylphospho-beta-D-erythro-pentofuranosid-2-ulose 2-reductase